MTASAGRERIVCTACELPFYADAEQCPYCGADASEGAQEEDETGFVFDTADSGGRDRTTCPTCGLPHYADADGCPYCEYAGAAADQEELEAEAGDVEPTTTDRPGEGGGLFGRLKRALGF